MQHSFMDQQQVVMVAVAFDQHTMGLARSAAAICRKTGKRLCLAHVIEPWMTVPPSRPFGAEDPLWNVTQAVEANARDRAEGHLAEIAESLGADLTVERMILAGRPVEALAEAALDSGCCLLLVGADYGNLRFMPRGFSTALSLMVSSPVPVCVLDTKLTPEFPTESPKFLLADDLGLDSEAAVAFGFGLAAAMGPSVVHHVHVNGMSLDTLKAGLNTAAASSHTPLNVAASAEEVFDALIVQLKDKLEARAQIHREYLDAAGGAVFTDVLTGEVNEQVGLLSTSISADLLLFGRHQAYHTKPFFIGRLPFRAMLAQKRPLIIVPNS